MSKASRGIKQNFVISFAKVLNTTKRQIHQHNNARCVEHSSSLTAPRALAIPTRMMKITILGDLVLGSAISCCTVRSPYTRTYHTARTSKYLNKDKHGWCLNNWITASMAPTDEQWMHSCLQSVDVSRRISLQVKTWKRKATIYLKPIRIQTHKFSDVKCSERSVKDSELIEAGQHFVSRELLHSFTCYTSQGHTRCQKSRLRLFIEISGVHHGNGCYNLVQVLACKKQHEQLVISCLSWHLLTYI